MQSHGPAKLSQPTPFPRSIKLEKFRDNSDYITAERIVAPAESAEPTTRLPAAKPWTPRPARANRIPPRAGRCLRVKRPLPIPTSARALEEIIIEGGMHTAADTTRSRETTARYKG